MVFSRAILLWVSLAVGASAPLGQAAGCPKQLLVYPSTAGEGVAMAGASSAHPLWVEIQVQQDSQLKTGTRWPLLAQGAED